MFSFSSSPPSIYDEPKKHEVKIEKHREPEKRIEMERDEYRDYVIKPLSKTFSRAPKHTRIFWENASREMMSSARLLPSIPPRENFASTQIIRKQFIQETDITPYRNNSTWWFYGQYNLFTQLWSSSQQKFLNGSTLIKQVLIREIDLTSCYFDERNAGVLKELYLLHFFEHENLLYALATESEPNLFRMLIISPLSIPLPDLEVMSNLKHFWQRRPFYPYIPICILRALKYLHERGIVHKNVRTGACLFDSYGNVFLGAFHKIEISDQERRKSDDIWCLGTTILDQIFQRDHYYPTFPNPASVLPDQSLIENLAGILRSNNNPIDIDRQMLLGTIPFFRFIPETSPLYAFLDLITQVHNRPTAAFLLEEYAYTKVNEDQFRQLKLNFRGYIEEFFAVPAPIPSPNAPDSKTSSSKYIRDEIPCDHFQRSLPRPRKKFRNGSVINVAFTLVSEIYTHYPLLGSFIVGEEHTMFKLLMSLLHLFCEPQNVPHEKRSLDWDIINVTKQLFEEWDVFRLRAALHTMLEEVANRFDERPVEGLMEKTSEFVLCNHREKLGRRVQIRIQYDSQNIVNIHE